MKRVNENLVQYRNESFFNRLVEAQEKEKQEQQKQPQKHAEKDPKTELDLKKEAQAAKDAQDIIKKIKENFARFKSYAGNQVIEYKHFWNMQQNAKQAVLQKDNSYKIVYALFNDGSTDKYKPNYVVCLKQNPDGKFVINVVKAKLDDGETNPIVSILNKEASEQFINLYSEIKDELKNVKNHHVETVEAKKQEEEEKRKREKLNTFLKESKSSIPNELKKNKEYQMIQSTKEFRTALKNYLKDKKNPDEKEMLKAHKFAFEKAKKERAKK